MEDDESFGGAKGKNEYKEKEASSRSTAAGIIYCTASGLHRMWVRSEGPRTNSKKKLKKKT